MEERKEDMKVTIASLASLALLGLIAAVCHGQDFSADVTYDSAPTLDASSRPALPPTSSKLYLSKDKMRLESQGLSDTIMLVDFANHTATILFPSQKAYQDLAAGPEQYFRVTDAEDACPDWQKAVGKPMTCSKVGNEVVDGRQAVKYEGKGASATGSSTFLWIDPALKFVTKWQDADGGAELHNIKEGPQPADLFAVPPRYDVLKPRKKPVGKAPRPK